LALALDGASGDDDFGIGSQEVENDGDRRGSVSSEEEPAIDPVHSARGGEHQYSKRNVECRESEEAVANDMLCRRRGRTILVEFVFH